MVLSLRVRQQKMGKEVIHAYVDLPYGSAGEEFACNAGNLGLIPGLGRYCGEGKG